MNASKRQRNSVAARCWFDRRRYSLITRLKKAKNWILWSIIVSVRQYIPEIGFCDGEGLFRRRNLTKWNSQTTTLKWVFISFSFFFRHQMIGETKDDRHQNSHWQMLSFTSRQLRVWISKQTELITAPPRHTWWVRAPGAHGPPSLCPETPPSWVKHTHCVKNNSRDVTPRRELRKYQRSLNPSLPSWLWHLFWCKMIRIWNWLISGGAKMMPVKDNEDESCFLVTKHSPWRGKYVLSQN